MNLQVGAIATAFLLGVILLLAAIESSRSWERFKRRHHCRLVGRDLVENTK